MKKFTYLFALLALLALCAGAMAQDYFVSNGIVYAPTPTSASEAKVVEYYHLLSSAYSGAITIPQTVENNGTTYTVPAPGLYLLRTPAGSHKVIVK